MITLYQLVINTLNSLGESHYPNYEKALYYAFQKNPPIQQKNWFHKNYFTLAREKLWFAHSLIGNARMEGYGSGQIWKFSYRIDNKCYV